MTGAVFFVVLLAVILIVGLGVASPIFLVPIVAIALGVIALPFLLGLLRRSSVAQADPGPTGVPETSEAAYEPVSDRQGDR